MKMPTSKGLSLVGDDQLTKTGVGENDTIRVNGGGGGGSSGGGSGSSGGGSNGGGGGGNGGNVVNNGGGGSVPETNGNTDRSMSYASSMIQMMDPIYNMSRIGYNQTDHGQPPVGPDGTTLVVSHHQMMDSHPSYNGSHQERGRHAITPDNIHPSLSHQLMESHHGYENVSRDRSRHSITPENLQTHQYLASARATYDPPAEQVHSDSQQLLSGRSNYDTVPDRRSALTPDSHTQKTRDTAKSLLLNNSKQQYSQHSSVGLVDPQMIKYEIPDLTGKGPPMGNENLLYKDVFVNSYDKVINRCLENPVIHQNGLVDVSAPHKIYPYARDSLMSQEGAPGKMMVPSSGMLAPSSTESLMGRQGSSAGMGDITGKVNSLQDDLQIRMDTRSKM